MIFSFLLQYFIVISILWIIIFLIVDYQKNFDIFIVSISNKFQTKQEVTSQVSLMFLTVPRVRATVPSFSGPRTLRSRVSTRPSYFLQIKERTFQTKLSQERNITSVPRINN